MKTPADYYERDPRAGSGEISAILDELERLERAATKAPWQSVSLGLKGGPQMARLYPRVCMTHPQEHVVSRGGQGGTTPSFDAEVIAAARNHLPMLIALARLAVDAVPFVTLFKEGTATAEKLRREWFARFDAAAGAEGEGKHEDR